MTRLAATSLLALLATACADAPPADPPAPTGPRTVVLVSIDTLRPDRLGVYGNPDADVSPRIDALADDAVVFDRAFATSPWTLPSHMSMLTGLDPMAHGVRDSGFHLSSAAYTLAEALHDDGFATGGFTDGGFVSADYGYDQGFDVYESERSLDGKTANGFARLLPDALAWLDAHLDDDVFLFVHTFDVHAPFHQVDEDVAAPFRARPVAADPRDPLLHRARYLKQQHDVGISRYDTLSALLADYDAGVHVADTGVGEILELLRRRGRYDDALVIVTSDHGESFFDHGTFVGHAMTLHDAELRIPLVVKLPGGEAAGARVDTPVDLTDLAPTILAAAGLDVPSDMSGDSLADLVRDGGDYARPPIVAASANLESYALIDGPYKYISAMAVTPTEAAQIVLAPMNPPLGERDVGSDYEIGTGDLRRTLRYDFLGDPLGILDGFVEHEQLFDRSRDPGELVDLSMEEPERVADMRRRLLEVWDSSATLNEVLVEQDENPDVPFSPGEAHALAMLGYLDTGSRKALRTIPKQLRRNLTSDDATPAMGALLELDRVVHDLRRAQAAGELGDDAAERMQTVGDAYAAWATEHEDHAWRALWRLFELGAVAKDAGIRLDVEPWIAGALPSDG